MYAYCYKTVKQQFNIFKSIFVFVQLFKLLLVLVALGVLDRAPQKDPSQLVEAAACSSPEPWTLLSPLAPTFSYDSEDRGPQSASWLCLHAIASQHSPDRMWRGRSRWTGYTPQGWRCCLGMRGCRTSDDTAQLCDWLGCRRGVLHWSWRNRRQCCLLASKLPWFASCWCCLQQRPIHPPNDAGPLGLVVGRVVHRWGEPNGSRPPCREEWWHVQQTSGWRRSSFNVSVWLSRLSYKLSMSLSSFIAAVGSESKFLGVCLRSWVIKENSINAGLTC